MSQSPSDVAERTNLLRSESGPTRVGWKIAKDIMTFESASMSERNSILKSGPIVTHTISLICCALAFVDKSVVNYPSRWV